MQAQEELLDRGLTRRHLGRVAALIGGGAGLNSLLVGSGAAQSQAARGEVGNVKIGANDAGRGPSPELHALRPSVWRSAIAIGLAIIAMQASIDGSSRGRGY